MALTAKSLTLVVALALPGVAPAHAQTADFTGKTVTIYIGYTAGGSYDLYGRLVSRHLGAHLPGRPTVVAENMPGAGSLKAANYLYKVAPKDGTALGVVVESTALEQALSNPAAQYDAAKFTYVGRVATSNNIFMMWHTAKAQSIEDAKRQEVILAGTAPLDRRHDSCAAQCFPRHQVQADQWLSRLQRGDARDGARRSRRLLILLGGREGGQAGLAARQDDPDFFADHARAGC